MPSKTKRVIAGRYELDDQLGRGAMGTVWRAKDRVLKRSVAIKEVEFPPAIPEEEREILEARVMREARAAARLAHPGAVTVFDVVEEDSRPWIVMEYIDAPTLDALVARDGPLSPERAALVGLELLAVLEAAHDEGIVHRDVKPGNVMCLPDGRAKLSDFGIASLQDDPKITSTGLVLGSPSFMAPEQAQSDRPGPSVDLWALGATLYYAVEGRAPFDKGQAIPTLTAVVDEDPPRPGKAGPLRDVIMSLLEKDPAARPDPGETRAALEAIANDEKFSTRAGTTPQNRPQGATKAYTRAAPAAPPAVATDEQPGGVRRPPPSDPSWNRWALALVAVVALLLALFLIPPLFDSGDEGNPTRSGQEDRSGEGAGAGAPDDVEPAEAPEGWTTYTEPETGWSIAYPAGWSATEGSIDDDSIDLSDPATGSYLRIDWNDEPGDDVMESLSAQEQDFAAEHSGYEQVQLTETEFQGFEAGLWEYTYFDGVDLHAYNLQFVTDNGYGFALNFQTHEDEWEESQDLWEQFQATFTPPQ